MASAPCSLMAARNGTILPSDFDIFLPCINTDPLTTI
jgi:hypothetical protein